MSNTDQGAVYIFIRTAGKWSLVQKLLAADGKAGDRFGTSVAISGGTIAVGAPMADRDDHIDQGAVYIFNYSGTSWSYQADVTANDGAALDNFGNAVALEQDTLVAGCAKHMITLLAEGAAYVFVRSSNLWSQQARLTASTTASR